MDNEAMKELRPDTPSRKIFWSGGQILVILIHIIVLGYVVYSNFVLTVIGGALTGETVGTRLVNHFFTHVTVIFPIIFALGHVFLWSYNTKRKAFAIHYLVTTLIIFALWVAILYYFAL